MLIGPQNSPLLEPLATNLGALQQEISASARAAGRSEDSVTLIAVSKGHPGEAVRAAAGLGLRDFGESYLQEALPKIAGLRDLSLRWHFIGRIQANKTRAIAEQFDWVHGIDRLHVAERLSAQRPHFAPPLQSCLQVNIDAEAGKAGVAPEAAGRAGGRSAGAAASARCAASCAFCRKAAVPPPTAAASRALRILAQQMAARGIALDTLSMGMSGDFHAAIAEGATMVRIGTALFGPRKRRP